MTILGPNVSLKQVGNDTGQPTGQLNGVHTRARLKDKKTGSISLKSLESATTSMCVSPVGLSGSDWNKPPTNTYQSFQSTSAGSDIRMETPSNDWTKDFRVGGTRRTNADAVFSVTQCGYADSGNFRFYGKAKADSGLNSAPYSIQVLAFSGGWDVGDIEIMYYQTASSTDYIEYALSRPVPAGKPYITVVGRQLIYGPLNQEGLGQAPVGVLFKASFEDLRLGKL